MTEAEKLVAECRIYQTVQDAIAMEEFILAAAPATLKMMQEERIAALKAAAQFLDPSRTRMIAQKGLGE